MSPYRIPYKPWILKITGPDQLSIEFEISATTINDYEQSLICQVEAWQITGPDIPQAKKVLYRLSKNLPEEQQ